jgi:PKD repeat protein
LAGLSLKAPDDRQTTLYVTATATEEGNGSSAVTERSAVVRVTNANPAVGPITASASLIPIGGSISVSSLFSDLGILDTHTARWQWGDGNACSSGTSTDCAVSEAGGSGTVSASHVYLTEGVYEVRLTITDDDGGAGTAVLDYITVYDPNPNSYSTGGGWIDSPAGACSSGSICAGAHGKANFGFNAKPEGKKNTPKGETQFSFGSVSFRSTSYSQLVISGAWSRINGSGRINDAGNYQFMLLAVDGEYSASDEFAVDRFRMRIWDGSGQAIYDNGLSAADGDLSATTALAGGSITVHAGK